LHANTYAYGVLTGLEVDNIPVIDQSGQWVGPVGPQGATGSQGTAGTIGVDGVQGAQGTAGSIGTNGTQGTQGVQGRQGVTGTGTQGATGTGTQGTQGTQGASITGSQGATGTGTQGATGAGTQGTQGSSGIAGVADDNSTNANYYPVSATAAGGSTLRTSSSQIYFNPSTGTLNSIIFNALSDKNFKENIQYIYDAIDVVKQLDGVSFNWKDNGNKSFGLIAQEVENILPELVDGTGRKSLNYNGLIGFLVNAIKELDARVQELEKK